VINGTTLHASLEKPATYAAGWLIVLFSRVVPATGIAMS